MGPRRGRRLKWTSRRLIRNRMPCLAEQACAAGSPAGRTFERDIEFEIGRLADQLDAEAAVLRRLEHQILLAAEASCPQAERRELHAH